MLPSFLAAAVTPVLTEAGFRRRGNEYLLDTGKTLKAVVGVYSKHFSICDYATIQYGVWTEEYLLATNYRSGRELVWPSTSYAILMSQLPVAGDVDTSGGQSLWRIGDDSGVDEASAREVEMRLRDLVIPTVKSWMEPEGLVPVITDLPVGHFPWPSRYGALALAFAGEQGTQMFNDLLAKLNENDVIRRYFEAKVAP